VSPDIPVREDFAPRLVRRNETKLIDEFIGQWADMDFETLDILVFRHKKRVLEEYVARGENPNGRLYTD
jgi:hypothetical protein